MDSLEKEIEKVAKVCSYLVWNFHCETTQDHAGVTKKVTAALREMAAFTRKQTLEEAIKSQCRFCAGLDPDVYKEPKFYEGHQYLPNFGEVDDEFIHGDKWDGYHYCECSIVLLRLQKGEEQP